MVKQIKLMTDYEASPLWWTGDAEPGNIDPGELPLSPELAERLWRWAESYDATLNPEDPMESGFKSAEEEAAFEREGVELWQRLARELAPEYEVLYYSERLGRVLRDPSEISEEEWGRLREP